MRSDEQRTADAELDDAVNRAARAYGVAPADYLLTEWVVVVESIKYGDDEDHAEHHGIMFRGGQGRMSVAAGLLRIAERMIVEDMPGPSIPPA